MWMLDNQTPFVADRTWVRDKEGAHQWIVVVKATYDIGRAGALLLADEPVAPLHSAEYHGRPGESSVRYDTDLVAMKPATDVYLNATAYAPRGRPQQEVEVSIRIGGLRKSLRVCGPRVWRRNLLGAVVPSSPRAFTTMPIRYECAYGGSDTSDPDPRRQRIDLRNPVGTGVALDSGTLIGTPAPSVDVAGGSRAGRGPAGFGAIANFWSPRRELAGTYDDRWAARRKPLLPDDYDPRWLLCAPVDQQSSTYLRGGEPVELVNLTPEGVTRFSIPEVSLRFETHFGSTRREHEARLVSVIVDSEGPRLILVWQTSLRCGQDADYLDKTSIRYKVVRHA